MNISLRGSRTEQLHRKDFEAGIESLKGSELSKVLARCGYAGVAIVLEHIPEQGEDIYTVLVSAEKFLIVELDRVGLKTEPLIKEVSLTKYRKGLSQQKQVQLTVALDML